MSDRHQRAFPTTKTMLEAGEREVQSGINLGMPARVIANACYQTMRRIGVPVGRPRVITDETRAEIMGKLRDGVSGYAVRKQYGVGGFVIAQMRKELLERGIETPPPGPYYGKVVEPEDVLRALESPESPSQSQVARYFGITPQRVSHVVIANKTRKQGENDG